MKRTTTIGLFLFTAALLSGPLSLAQVPQHLNYQGRVAVQGVNFNGTGQFKFALVDGGTNLSQAATATGIATAMISSINIISGGSGYTTPPIVTIPPPDDPGGVQATATATIDGGVVTAITLDEAGTGYFNNPVQVTIAPPPEDIEHQTYWSNSGDLAPGEIPGTSVSLPVANGLYSVRLGDNSLPNMAPFLITDIFYTPLFLRVWFDDGVNGLQQLSPDQALASAPYALHSELAENVPNGAITSNKLANGAVTSFKLAANAVTGANLANASISPAKLATTVAPTAGQTLLFDGTEFIWSPQGLTLPYSGSASSGEAVVSIRNNSNGAAIEATGTAGDGVKALTGGAGKSAIFGQTNAPSTGQGVFGYGLFGATGVLGVSNSGDGVSGRTNGNGKTGVFGYAEGSNSSGLHGHSSLHHGLYAYTGSTNKAAIYADAPNGAEAIHGHSDGGDGVVGFTAASAKAGVFGFSDVGNGVVGHAHAAERAGIHGWSDNEIGFGGYFSNPNGIAVKADGHIKVDGYVSATSNIISERQIRSNQGCVFSWDGETIFSTNPNGASCQKDLTVRGNINHYGAIHNLSDARLKDIAGDYERGLADIARIHTIRYSFKPSEEMPSAGEPRVGVTAQELREVIPEAVKESADGKLMMSTEPVFWAMVNSIKELKAENHALKKQLADENASLKRRLEALEAKSK